MRGCQRWRQKLTKNDLTKFAGLMNGLAAMYRIEISDPMLQVYWRALIEYDFELIDSAAMEHVKDPESGTFMPKPADLIKKMKGVRHDAAALIWAEIRTDVRKCAELCKDNPALLRAVRALGGSGRIGMATEKELDFMRPIFIDTYCASFKANSFKHELPPSIFAGLNLNQTKGLENGS